MKLITLSLSNFKCFDSLEINFKDDVTDIVGSNGSGKTSICDAYFWLLFGKNSAGQELNPRPKKPEATKTTVTAKLEIEARPNFDGGTYYLTRIQQDKPQKLSETAKSATETTYLINDVPKKKKDYDELVNLICSKDIFNVLSNPLAFASGNQKSDWQKRREILVQAFAKSSSDSDIINSHEELAPLRERLNYKSIDDFLNVTTLEHKKTNKRLEEIPVELNVHNQTISDTQTAGEYKPSIVAKLTAEKRNLEREIYSIENGDNVTELNRRISKVKAEIELAELKYKKEHSNADEVQKIYSNIADVNSEIFDLKTKNESLKRELSQARSEANNAKTRYDEYASETMSEDTTCPTCHQQLPEHLVSEKQALFNQQKAEKMKRESEIYRKNREIYQSKKSELENLNAQLAELEKKLEELKAEKERLTNSENSQRFNESSEYKTLAEKLKALESELEKCTSEADKLVAEKRQQASELQKQIDEQESIKAAQVLIDKQNEHIEKLRDEQQRLSKLLVEQEESIELTQKFMQYKISDIEEQINSHFELVKWKLFEPQVNGIIKDCCEATVDGVGFNEGLNTAAKINAGLDIINTLSQVYGQTMPVWVDNAESVTQLKRTDGQQIRLYVAAGQENIKILD